MALISPMENMDVCDNNHATETVPETDSETAPSEPTLNDVVASIRELKNGLQANFQMLHELTSASVAMQATLRKLEIFIATPKHETPTYETPTHEGTLKKGIFSDNNNNAFNEMSVVQDAGDIFGSAGKRKAYVPDFSDEDIRNVILSITDDEEENAGKKICRPTASKKINNILSICKPDLPSSWTRSSSKDKGKSAETLVSTIENKSSRHKVSINNLTYFKLIPLYLLLCNA